MQAASESKYLFLYGGAIGDALLGIHVGRTLSANMQDARLVMVSTRRNDFVRELAAPLPFIDYRELPKEDFRSWLTIVGFLRYRWHTAVFEPATAKMPLWWRLVLFSTSRRKGGAELHYQMKLHERKAPSRARVTVYDCSKINLFDLAADAVRAWGVSVREKAKPKLDLPGGRAPFEKPYIVFHFFAGHYRRSIPVENARELLREARKRYPEHLFVLTCSAHEVERARRVARGISNIEIKSDLPALALLLLLGHAALVVGTASGVIHLAAHLPVPVVSLCNLSDPCWLPSYNPDVVLLFDRARCCCSGNRSGVCEAHTPEGPVFRCLYDIKTETVIAAMQKKLLKTI